MMHKTIGIDIKLFYIKFNCQRNVINSWRGEHFSRHETSLLHFLRIFSFTELLISA